MKAFLTVVLLFSSVTAKADFSCEKKTEVFPPTAIISYSSATDLYSVAIVGYRPTHAAQYKATESYGTRYGWSATLTKVNDQSTFSDMPATLSLKDYLPAQSYILVGLTKFSTQPLVFNKSKDCEKAG